MSPRGRMGLPELVRDYSRGRARAGTRGGDPHGSLSRCVGTRLLREHTLMLDFTLEEAQLLGSHRVIYQQCPLTKTL